ncbi:MAG: metallophosphoesterase family protein [Leptolyngbyaceae cyanobacterium]
MQLVTDASDANKISKMQARVRWQHPAVVDRSIDQTQLFIDDGGATDTEFSFTVLGDSGTGRYRGDSPQRRVAKAMMEHGHDARFCLHTGDVVYLVGSSEQYFENFINPYREWLVGGETPKKISYDQMVFRRPILPTLGNHDYYNLPLILGAVSALSNPFRRLLRSYIDIDVGWHGSYTGKAYAQAFIDCLGNLDQSQLQQHLDQHYTAANGTCLNYVPGKFTRLPNRYYTFRYGGIDFFALDSNTFNEPSPVAMGKAGIKDREQLTIQQAELEKTRTAILEKAASLDPDDPEQAEQIGDLTGEAEQLGEEIRDISKQLKAPFENTADTEQLNWLRDRLIASWQDPTSRGRLLYFHHPPYVTEATKWSQAQTLAVRQNLRQVLTDVKQALGSLTDGRPLVDLIVNGHAHCLEYLRTADSGLADANIPCLVCGGSGYSLRRQRSNGLEVSEIIEGRSQHVATSHMFIGRQGQGSQKHRPYSCLRIDVKPGNPPKFVVKPIVVDKFKHKWHQPEQEPFVL